MGLKNWLQEIEPPYVLSDAILQFIDTHLSAGQAAEVEDWLQEWIHPPTRCHTTARYFNTLTVAIVVYGQFRIEDDGVLFRETLQIIRDLKVSYDLRSFSITQKVAIAAAVVLMAERSVDPFQPEDPRGLRGLNIQFASVVDDFYRSQESLTLEQVARVKRLLELLGDGWKCYVQGSFDSGGQPSVQ